MQENITLARVHPNCEPDVPGRARGRGGERRTGWPTGAPVELRGTTRFCVQARRPKGPVRSVRGDRLRDLLPARAALAEPQPVALVHEEVTSLT